MVAPIEQIERDIKTLEQSTAALVAQLQAAGETYLRSLGQAVRRQLILTSYHLCTQNYPQQFLALSMRQRQALQQMVQQLAQQAEQEFSEQAQTWVRTLAGEQPLPPPADLAQSLVVLSAPTGDAVVADATVATPAATATTAETAPPLETSESVDLEPTGTDKSDADALLFEAIAADFPLASESLNDATAGDAPPSAEAEPPSDATPSSDPSELANRPNPAEARALAAALKSVAKRGGQADLVKAVAAALTAAERGRSHAWQQAQAELNPDNPIHVLRLLSLWEGRVSKILQDLSLATNRKLQQGGILPEELPEPVFAVAAQAGDAAESISATQTPHLLKLLVEVPRDEAEDDLDLDLEELAAEQFAADLTTAALPADDDEPEPPKRHVAPLVAIHLRRSELEFSDPQLSTQRQQLRRLHQQLERLASTYRHKQKQHQIAAAEAAWRASWVEE